MLDMSISADQRNELNAILQMSDEEAAVAEAKILAEIDSIVEKLLGKEEDADTPEKKAIRAKRKKMIEIVKKRAEQGKPIDVIESDSALSRMIREINRMRNGADVPPETPIPWRQLLSQKASTLKEYRQRIFEAISSSEDLKCIDNARKSKLADLFAQNWESNRTRILAGKIDHLINEEEAAKRITKDGAEALRNQRMKIVEDLKLGRFNTDKLGERLYDGMKQLARNRGSDSCHPPPALLPTGPDIWTAVSGSDCYMVPYQSKPRSTSTQRRYRDKEITHGFPVKNLREFFFFSNRVVSAGYDAPNRRLYLKFDANSMYQYFNVPEDMVRGLINASSHGSYASRRICYAFKYERLPFPPPPPAVVNVVKASSSRTISTEERDELNAILSMPKEEREKAKAKDLAEFDSLMAKILGDELADDTPEPLRN